MSGFFQFYLFQKNMAIRIGRLSRFFPNSWSKMPQRGLPISTSKNRLQFVEHFSQVFISLVFEERIELSSLMTCFQLLLNVSIDYFFCSLLCNSMQFNVSSDLHNELSFHRSPMGCALMLRACFGLLFLMAGRLV